MIFTSPETMTATLIFCHQHHFALPSFRGHSCTLPSDMTHRQSLQVLLKALEDVPRAVAELAPLVDFTVEVSQKGLS